MIDVNLLQLLEKYSCSEKETNEDTGAGAVAGFSAPMGDKNSIVKKKTVKDIDEGEEDENHLNQGEVASFEINETNQEQASEKTFNSTNFEVTRAYRGPNKGYTLMVRQVTGDGKMFEGDSKVQQVINFLESIF